MKKLILFLLLFIFLDANDLERLYDINHSLKPNTNPIYKNMCKYISSNNFHKLQHILDKGTDPNIILPIKLAYTPLYYATLLGHIKQVKLLLSHGANIDLISPPNDEGKYANTAISASIANNDLTLTRLLLESNASINITNEQPIRLICHKRKVINPPFFYAYSKEMVELLISYGAHIDQQNAYGETILDWYIGSTDLKYWLMEKYNFKPKYYKCYNKSIVEVSHLGR